MGEAGRRLCHELTARGRQRTARVAADGGDREAARRAVGVSDYHVEPAADGEEHSAEVVFTASRAGSLDFRCCSTAARSASRCGEVEAARRTPTAAFRGGGAAEAVVGEPLRSSSSPRPLPQLAGVGGAAVEASLVAPGVAAATPGSDNGGGSYNGYTATVAGEHALT